jgi:lysophospholipase L1-like esterase
MPLGDSITAGYNSSTGNGYRQPLAAALASQIGSLDFVGTQDDGIMADPDNEGHFGYRIDQIASLTNAALNTYKPNIVTLDAGINDLTQGYDISDAPSRLASLIDQILAAEPEATVLVATLINNPDPTTGSEVVTFNNALPAIIQARASAGKHVYLVDMSALTTADIGGVHPNDAGYQLMANAWDGAIQQVITNGWITDPVPGSASRPTGTVYSGLSGMCLDDFAASASAGNKVDIYECNATPAQQWNLNNGQVIVNGLCLDINGGGTANRTLVDLWGCSGAANQVWLEQNGTLYNPASGRCLDDPGATTNQGTQLQIYDCDNTPAQQWRVPVEGPMVSGLSGKCLDVLGGNAANGTVADSYDCNNTPAQQWKITNDTLTFNGKCLDITANGTSNGSLVEVWTCNGGPNQTWVPTNGTLLNPVSGRCLDIPGGNTTNGTQLDIWDCNGGSNQQWTLPPGNPQS